MSSTVSWNLQVSIRDGQADSFRALMTEMVESTKGEAGTQCYEWFISEDGSTCHIYERYDDSGAVMAHLGTFGAKFMDRFMGCVQPTGFAVYGDPSAEARGALAGFGAVHYAVFGGFCR